MNLAPAKIRLSRMATPMGLGIAGIVVCVIGAMADFPEAMRAWLFGWLMVLGIALGCFAWVTVHHMSGGAWGFLIRRIGEAGGLTLPLVMLLGVPLIFGAHHVFPWADHDSIHHSPLSEHRHAFFNSGWVLARSLIFFAGWILLAWLLASLSLKHDRDNEPRLLQRMAPIAVIGAIFYFVTMSIMSFDLIKSREIDFYSSTFGVVTVLGQVTSGLCVMIMVLSRLKDQPAMAAIYNEDRVHDLGNLLLTSTVLWSYTSFAQYLVIWIGNTQEDNTWFVHRARTGWWVIGAAIIVLHFFVPFILLLFQRTKRDIRALAVVALGVFVMRILDVLWMVAPSSNDHHDPGKPGHANWMDPFALIGIGGVWLAVFLWLLGRRAVVPRAYHDEIVVPNELASHGHAHGSHGGDEHGREHGTSTQHA